MRWRYTRIGETLVNKLYTIIYLIVAVVDFGVLTDEI